jgi:DTW domain-containing protein YfiP
MPIGTARLAHLGLPGSTLLAATQLDDHPVVEAWLAAHPGAHVLFPGPGARDIRELAHRSPDAGALNDGTRAGAHAPSAAAPVPALIVVDGTWWQAQKLLRLNPRLAALPRVAFTPVAPSRYRIRKQPEAFCVSTIEAVAEVLSVLEPESGPYDGLLAPFVAMVEAQLRFAREVSSHRHAAAQEARARKKRPTFPERVADVWDRIVCVQGEANAWPAKVADRPRPELVHWVAHRLRDGARFEAIISPTGPLAPSTPFHVGLSAARIEEGMTSDAWKAAWNAYVAPDDILVYWGRFHENLAAEAGATSTAGAWDLRFELSRWRRARIGLLEEALALVAPATAPAPEGLVVPRALRRLEGLVALLQAVTKVNVTRAP